MTTHSLLPLLIANWALSLVLGIFMVNALRKGTGIGSLISTEVLLLLTAILTHAVTWHDDRFTATGSFVSSILIGVGVFLLPLLVWSTRFLFGRNRLFPWSRQ